MQLFGGTVPSAEQLFAGTVPDQWWVTTEVSPAVLRTKMSGSAWHQQPGDHCQGQVHGHHQPCHHPRHSHSRFILLIFRKQTKISKPAWLTTRNKPLLSTDKHYFSETRHTTHYSTTLPGGQTVKLQAYLHWCTSFIFSWIIWRKLEKLSCARCLTFNQHYKHVRNNL